MLRLTLWATTFAWNWSMSPFLVSHCTFLAVRPITLVDSCPRAAWYFSIFCLNACTSDLQSSSVLIANSFRLYVVGSDRCEMQVWWTCKSEKSSVCNSLINERYSATEPLTWSKVRRISLIRILTEIKSPKEPNVGANAMVLRGFWFCDSVRHSKASVLGFKFSTSTNSHLTALCTASTNVISQLVQHNKSHGGLMLPNLRSLHNIAQTFIALRDVLLYIFRSFF